MKNQNTSQQSIHNSTKGETDLIALVKTVWNKRRTIIKITLVFFVIGLFIAIFSPKQYRVSSVMVPQVSDGTSKLGGLSSLAAMAGFNLDMSTGSELNPIIYPQIIQSIPFKMELMQTKFNFEDIKHPITYYEYYTEYAKINPLDAIQEYTIGLPGLIRNALKGIQKPIFQANNKKSILMLTEEEEAIAEILDKNVYLEINDKDGSVSLIAIMPEALASAELGLKAQFLLQKYITEFKIEKAQDQLNFVEERYFEKKESFLDAQKALASFRDENKNVSSAVARTEEELLQSEYQIAQSVYNELAKQVESFRINVKEKTPVFSIIKPISIPSKSFKPKRKLILFMWVFLGFIVGIGWVLGRSYYSIFKDKWNELEI